MICYCNATLDGPAGPGKTDVPFHYIPTTGSPVCGLLIHYEEEVLNKQIRDY